MSSRTTSNTSLPLILPGLHDITFVFNALRKESFWQANTMLIWRNILVFVDINAFKRRKKDETVQRMQHQWFPHSVASCQRYFQKFYHGRIINVNFSLSIHRRSHGVMVSTLDFESSDPSSNLGGTYFYFSIFLFLLIFLLQLSIFLLLNFYFTVFRHKSNELLINTIFYFILIKSGRLPRHADSFPVLSHY